VTIPDDLTKTFRLEAEYELLSQVVVNATPLGADLLVDGTVCAIPCRIDRPSGTEIRLAAPQTKSLSDVHRLDFVSWSDGAARERAYTLSGPEAQTLNVNYRTAYLLTAIVDPPRGAKLVLDPQSEDGFYPQDTFLTVTVEVQQGFKFRRYEGELSGTGKTATISMSKPRTFVAHLDQVPYIASAGIRNAAGVTPDGLVAPGSLITVFGEKLAPHYEIGPASPLSQAIAGVSLVVGNRILPLMFVSPEQINAQLPRDLPPGEHTLHVIRIGEAPIEGKFTVVACAPGLFGQTYDDQEFVVALHEDGSAVTPQSPARKGELVSVYGTGFGAYKLFLAEGFAAPPTSPFELQEDVQISTGEHQPGKDWAGAAPGMVGTDVIRFRVTEPMSGNLPLKMRMGAHESNTVLLPVE
jgi:uncharacterized protein (TIGR03437 family)